MEETPKQSDEKQNNKLQEKLELAEKERDEYLNGWKRAKADLINARKEWEEKMKNLGGYVRADIILSILPILDAFEGTKDIEGWNEMQKLTSDIFMKIGVNEIESVGKEFNPEIHESAGQTEGEENIVIEVIRKGYKIGDAVIRPAKVIIGKSN
jgi:molecular chaperone GrpE